MNASPTEVSLILKAIEQVETRVASVEAKVDTLAEQFAADQHDQNQRIEIIEAFRWKLVGAATLIATSIGFIAQLVLR